jgi:hypothetical protein
MAATLHVMPSILAWTTVAAAILAQVFITVRLGGASCIRATRSSCKAR